MDAGGAMLWGRVTYEMMESYWPAVVRGDGEAPPAMRESAVKLEAKPKYVVSARTCFSTSDRAEPSVCCGWSRANVQIEVEERAAAGVRGGSPVSSRSVLRPARPPGAR
jgi:hypothetical protein